MSLQDEGSRSLLDWVGAAWEWSSDFVVGVVEENRREALYAVGITVYAVIRAAGRTVQSGNRGLKFSFGRATRVLEPGFYPLIPFLQIVRVLPSRQRTLDLPRQRVTTLDGLVFDVDANLVYRITDVRKALIEIDDLEKGMLQMLGLAVQQVLCARGRDEMYTSEELDATLSENMAGRLAPWGVEVERAGFTSIRPTDRTLRVTQLATRMAERVGNLQRLERLNLRRGHALVLLGQPSRITRRTELLRTQARRNRRRSRRRRIVDRYEVALLEEAGFFQRAARKRIEKQRELEEGRRVGRQQSPEAVQLRKARALLQED